MFSFLGFFTRKMRISSACLLLYWISHVLKHNKKWHMFLNTFKITHDASMNYLILSRSSKKGFWRGCHSTDSAHLFPDQLDMFLVPNFFKLLLRCRSLFPSCCVPNLSSLLSQHSWRKIKLKCKAGYQELNFSSIIWQRASSQRDWLL